MDTQNFESKTKARNYYIRQLTEDDVINIYNLCKNCCHFSGEITGINMPGINDMYVSISREHSTDIFISDFDVARHINYPQDAEKAQKLFRSYMYKKFGEEYLVDCVRDEFKIGQLKEKLAREQNEAAEIAEKIENTKSDISMALIAANGKLYEIKEFTAEFNALIHTTETIDAVEIPEADDMIKLHTENDNRPDLSDAEQDVYNDIEEDETENR